MPLEDAVAPNAAGLTNGAVKTPHDGAAQRTLAQVCADVAGRVNRFLGAEASTQVLRDVQTQTRIALGVIGECLERYSLEEISLSYNGGKDCLVLLILLLASLHYHIHPDDSPLKGASNSTKSPPALPLRLETVYIVSSHPFPEVTSFVDTSSETYALCLSRYNMPMKQAFEKYLEDSNGVKAILVGTRRTDPHGEKLTHFDMTDGGWPRFMRVHPVIDWHYREIWGFIRALEIPYCPLYDQGYTSLGGTTDTHPNPALKAKATASTEGGDPGKTQMQGFRPAYELVEDEEERLGRDW